METFWGKPNRRRAVRPQRLHQQIKRRVRQGFDSICERACVSALVPNTSCKRRAESDVDQIFSPAACSLTPVCSQLIILPTVISQPWPPLRSSRDSEVLTPTQTRPCLAPHDILELDSTYKLMLFQHRISI